MHKTIHPTPEVLFPGLFESVQMNEVFSDSKTFVDCTPKQGPTEIMAAFEAEKGLEGFHLKAFVSTHFQLPEDYSSGFEADSNRSAEDHVHALWPFLSRKGGSRKIEGDSLIPIPNDYIVPGGRFGEIYYWDSYFTMLGLAVSGREDMIENMVRNFAFMIETLGHIPNGNRSYFTSRSQPPFFAYMVQLLSDLKGSEIIDRYLPFIEEEYRFWMTGERYLPELGVNRYWDDMPIPRQESYREDVELAESSNNDSSSLYRHLRAACESGWDFSSRWLNDGTTLETIEAADIVPVDLNALLFGVESILIASYKNKGDSHQARAIELKQSRRKAFIELHCWDEQKGIYCDYHIRSESRTKIQSLATVYPLFVGLTDSKSRADTIAHALEKSFLKPGGLVTSLHHTGQQWDAPNGWAPLQWLAVKGLQRYGQNATAEEVVKRWTHLNEKVYRSTGKFVEKYNVEDLDLEAGGGEYPVQDGFGWSNGVYLALMDLVD